MVLTKLYFKLRNGSILVPIIITYYKEREFSKGQTFRTRYDAPHLHNHSNKTAAVYLGNRLINLICNYM